MGSTWKEQLSMFLSLYTVTITYVIYDVWKMKGPRKAEKHFYADEVIQNVWRISDPIIQVMQNVKT